MPITFEQVDYRELSGKQKEAYNFQKVSAVLANFGIVTIRLSNDWNGADFIAQLHDGKTFLRVQLKSRLTFHKKYHDKDLSSASGMAPAITIRGTCIRMLKC